MENYSVNDVRWMAFYSRGTGKAKVIPYIVREDSIVEDLLTNKVFDKKTLTKSKVLDEKNNDSVLVSKDWSTEEMINNYYKALKNVSSSHVKKFVEKYEELDVNQIQSWTHKLERELSKMAKEKQREYKKETKTKLKLHNDEVEF